VLLVSMLWIEFYLCILNILSSLCIWLDKIEFFISKFLRLDSCSILESEFRLMISF